MKLYTEEQVRKAIAIGFDWCHQKQIPSDWMIDDFIKELTPTELPSDYKIKHEAITQMEQWYGSGCEEEIFAFINGAKYVINKIQVGNQ